ncbi:M48 family metallopeptidase [Halovenus halobia]|uniref:M48 family metallopeptidase n=1 Tax=Halovenus halobia TaxID=3396622 RepID=UPI003F5706E7
MARSQERVRPAGHWELAVLMALTGGAILACYLAVVVALYPLVGVVSLPLYLGVAIAAAVAASLATTSYQLASVRRNTHQITPDSDPRLHETVESMSEKLGIAPPELYLVDADEPNARAIGTRWSGAIVFNSGLYERLSEAELDAIVGYELSHLYYCDSLVTVASAYVEWFVRRLAAMVAVFVNLVAFVIIALVGTLTRSTESRKQAGRRARINRLVGQVCVGAAGLVVLLPRNALSRYREFVADRTAAALLGDPEPMVGALKALDTHAGPTGQGALDPVNAVETRLRVLYATHPSIDRRIDVLRSDGHAAPTPTDPGPILGTGTRFGLTVAPALVVAGYVGVLGYAMEWVSVTAASQLLSAVIAVGSGAVILVAICAFVWAMVFGAGGQLSYGLLTVCGTAAAGTAAVAGQPVLVVVAATPAAAVAVAHLLRVGSARAG